MNKNIIIDDWEYSENSAELLDIICCFQEGFNTNLHCRELTQCILNAGFRKIKKEKQ